MDNANGRFIKDILKPAFSGKTTAIAKATKMSVPKKVVIVAYDVNIKKSQIKEGIDNRSIKKMTDKLRDTIFGYLKYNYIDKKLGIRLSESAYAISLQITQKRLFDIINEMIENSGVKEHVSFSIIPLINPASLRGNTTNQKWLDENLPTC